MAVPFDPDKLAAELSARGKAWAETDAAAKALDDATKSIMANIMCRQNEGSEASKERAARASQEFMDHLKDLSEARKLASIARVNYDVMKVFIDMKRSELSYSKAEMSIR
jgi:hypothetical protein